MKAVSGMAFDRQTFDQLIEKGTFIVGSPNTVREKIEAAHARVRVQEPGVHGPGSGRFLTRWSGRTSRFCQRRSDAKITAAR